MDSEQRTSLFPDAKVTTGGWMPTPQGDMVWTNYVDLSGKIDAKGLCLVKATKPEHDLRTTATIRLSRPGVFRNTGEVLIQDDQEGLAYVSSNERVEVANGDTNLSAERAAALNAAMQLGRTKMSVNSRSSEWKSSSSTANVSFGKDWLIYCTSMKPSEEDEEAWRKSLPEGYTSATTIYRPTQFAQVLGLGVSEYIGIRGKPEPIKGQFSGFQTVEEKRRCQMVLHGPMLYVDNPYGWISEAEVGWEKICAMCFLKSRERDQVAQREYRFILLSIGDEIGDVFDLPVSGMLKDCLLPVRYPEGKPAEATALVQKDEGPGGEERITGKTYTYRRRTTQTKRSGWSQGKDGEEEAKEVTIEETVTSPEEVPEPFPSKEERRPDVIMIHQMGGHVRFVHEAYRDEVTTHWRVETLARNPAIAEGPEIGARPRELTIPPELRYETRNAHPVDPRFVLEMCLNPSEPKPPIPYRGLPRCSQAEIEHVLACGESLRMAVDLLDGVEQARAAASGWYAQRFVLDLVTWFGPIVRSVFVMRDGVAVVELMRAPLTGAVAEAAFAGARTYLLHIDDGTVEENVFPGEVSRAGQLSATTFVNLLERYGWTPKRDV